MPIKWDARVVRERCSMSLSERVLDENLGAYGRFPRPCEQPRAVAPNRAEPRADALGEQEVAEVAWLYSWSHAALRASPRVPDRDPRSGPISGLRRRLHLRRD